MSLHCLNLFFSFSIIYIVYFFAFLLDFSIFFLFVFSTPGYVKRSHGETRHAMRRCVLSSLKKKREKRRVRDFLLSRLIIFLTRDSFIAFSRSDVKTEFPVGIYDAISMSMTMINVDEDRSNDPLFVSRLSFNELIIRFPFFYSSFLPWELLDSIGFCDRPKTRYLNWFSIALGWFGVVSVILRKRSLSLISDS